MEEIKQYIVTNWPAIVEYTIMAIVYFLVILYRSKVNSTRRDLTVLFKEKVNEVDTTDTKLRQDVRLACDAIKLEFANARKNMANELAEAKANYQKAIDAIYDVRNRVTCTENAIKEIIVEEVIVDGQDTNDEET